MRARREAGLRTGVGGEAGGRARQSGLVRVRVVLGLWGGGRERARGRGVRVRAGEIGAAAWGNARALLRRLCGAGRHLGHPSCGVRVSRTVLAAVHGRKCRGLVGGGEV